VLAIYVVMCQKKTPYLQIFCNLILNGFSYGHICFRDNCTVISIVYLKIAGLQDATSR